MSKTIFKKDLPNKKIFITREFAGPLELVWQAWTDSNLLDEWWAPKPYKSKTKKMDFREGGFWLYAMMGPEGDAHWCRADYKKIVPLKSYEAVDAFCDEHGNTDGKFPNMSWKNSFTSIKNGTRVDIEITYASVADMEKIIEMGFEVGFAAGHTNLDDYLMAQSKLRNELKASTGSRVSTYLNFPGNTEEAFNFYRSVFKTEFNGSGMQRFGDIPAEAGHPPLSEADKKLILHVELPVLGGHIIMATDAPESMGFKISRGDNMHINLEPETRRETKRLYDALSAGGKVTMELQDMFWGAYFGSCTDKFGINWMFNCVEKK